MGKYSDLLDKQIDVVTENWLRQNKEILDHGWHDFYDRRSWEMSYFQNIAYSEIHKELETDDRFEFKTYGDFDDYVMIRWKREDE